MDIKELIEKAVDKIKDDDAMQAHRARQAAKRAARKENHND